MSPVPTQSPQGPQYNEPALLSLSEQWLVLNKPAGWLSIPASRGSPGVPVISEWAKEKYGAIWVVHRLDRETSGVLLFARSAEAHRLGNGWFQSHQIKKAYDCLASGVPRAPVLRVKRPVGGVPSASQVEVKERFERAFLARVTPLTGRRHQIRVHLSEEGHPLLGDPQYGGQREIELVSGPLCVERVALHAAKLELPTREVFEAAWPADFKGWVERLRIEREQRQG